MRDYPAKDTFDTDFFTGYSSALIDPLLLVRRKVRRYAIDFVGFLPMAAIVEIGTKSVSLIG